MALLYEQLAKEIPELREEVKEFLAKHGDKIISEVSIAQAYGGMRGVKGLVCDTSVVEPDDGLVIRGIPIAKLTDKLPEEIFYLLLTGKLPSKKALQDLQDELKTRSEVPDSVWKTLDGMSSEAHPMRMLSVGVLAMGAHSIFRRKYDSGLEKSRYWEAALEDALELLARLPAVAAYIYRKRFHKGPRINRHPDYDWAANYAHMMGVPDASGQAGELMRLYLTLHSDHEGGNVSAFTSHVVSSALSDPYYAISAGFNGLAGPLHGLANQECLKFVLDIRERYNGVPTEDQFRDFCWENLNAGRVIPGYGHAVLRVTDPRYTALYEFGRKVCPDDEVFRIVEMGFHIIPDILKEQGKAKSPWPNVDAGSGALLHHFGITEVSYYTVLFSVSRALGLLAQLILDRALLIPITRPKSVSLQWLKANSGKFKKPKPAG